MIAEERNIRYLVTAPIPEVLHELSLLKNADRVGLMAELLITGTTNEKWARQKDVLRKIHGQVAPIIHKFDMGFLIEAFRNCETVFVQNGAPALWPWTYVCWRDSCVAFQSEYAKGMNGGVLTDSELAALEKAVSVGGI